MSYEIFIRNPNTEDVGLQMFGADGFLNNKGPEGAVVIEAGKAAICLAPSEVLPDAKVTTTKAIELEGNFVIQVGDDIIPHIFKAEDLSSYFDEDDTNQTGIQFRLNTDVYGISCDGAETTLYGFQVNEEQTFNILLKGVLVPGGPFTLEQAKNILLTQSTIMISASPVLDQMGNPTVYQSLYFTNTNLTETATCQLTATVEGVFTADQSIEGAGSISDDGLELSVCLSNCAIPLELDLSNATSTAILTSADLVNSTMGVVGINCASPFLERTEVPGESRITVYGELPYINERMGIVHNIEEDGSVTWTFTNKTTERLYVYLHPSSSIFDMRASNLNTNSSVKIGAFNTTNIVAFVLEALAGS